MEFTCVNGVRHGSHFVLSGQTTVPTYFTTVNFIIRSIPIFTVDYFWTSYSWSHTTYFDIWLNNTL